jgi:2-oxoglutarate ferredoxin oxidoreductase subunit alpha
MYDQTINAFNLAERYRVPVILLGEQAVGHLRERMDVREKIAIFNRRKEKRAAPFGAGDDGVPPMPAFGEGEKLLVTGSTHDDYGVRKVADPLVQARLTARLHNKIVKNREEIIQYEGYYTEDAEVMVIAYGFTARSSLFAVESIRRDGKKVGMIRLKTIWPFADSLIRDVGSRAKKIFVPEMNRGQIAGEIMKYTCGDIIPYNQTDGEVIHPNTIMGELRRLL